MVSIRDVAKHAGVAISTVSKVLNHYPNVSDKTKETVSRRLQGGEISRRYARSR